MKKSVFISYTTADKACADAIVATLEKAGVSCFIAPRDIDPGMGYASNLMHAIANCDVVVLIASASMNKSEHVLNEIDALVEKKKMLIPFFIEDFEMNDDFRYYLGRKQRIVAYPEPMESYFAKLLDAVISALPKQQQVHCTAPTVEENTAKSTIFEYLPERGIMINPEDHQRNVSFRTDTFINMFSGIFHHIEKLSDSVQAERAFYECGYSSGHSFGARVNDQWDSASLERLSLQEKIRRWTIFDSAVGWGKFTSAVTIDEEQGTIGGNLIINECFTVDKVHNRKICGYIRGYCEGVLSVFLEGMPIKLTCVECPMKNKFKVACVFKIETEEE